jgi:coenzyme F420-0:L-glutamate ligase / coenzyme F420-1:gamma-L-glutamate ligase
MDALNSPKRSISVAPINVQLTALAGVPIVKAGDDLIAIIIQALSASREVLRDGDVLVIAQKIISKAHNRFVHLRDVVPSPRSELLARDVNKDPRLVELILRESTDVVRHRRDVLVVSHKLGLVMANAGIDQSNVEQGDDDDTVLLLPEDPDETCAQLAESLRVRTGAAVGIIINDSHGRAFRSGAVGVAIGAYGVPALADLRGAPDLYGRRLRSTDVGVADEMASAASLLMGQADEGRPIVLIRGLPNSAGHGTAADLIRPKSVDLFRAPANSDPAELISTRRSIRRYEEMPVTDAVIERILEAAVSAPSAHNRQPWRFAVIKASPVKSRLARAMADRLREDRSRDGDPADVIEADVARSMARINGAPAIIVVCLTVEEMDRYPDARRTAAEHQMAVQGTAMAMQNLLLAAHALDLGASVMCAPLFCPDTVRTALALPDDWEPQALVTLGLPANEGKPRHRKPLGDVVRKVDV